MSKPFSFGLKKANPLAKPAPPRKPNAFNKSSAFDTPAEASDGEPQETNEVEITELSTTTFSSSTTSKGDDKKKKLSKSTQPPSHPPRPKNAPPIESSSTNNPYGDLSSAITSRKHAESAAAADPDIYDYDAAYDKIQAARKAARAASQEAANQTDEHGNRKPKYFDALQAAAQQRERDRQLNEERRLQREREKEGGQFEDKEKFVTEAYRKKQEELRRLREEEERKELEEKKAREQGRGMADFFKGVLAREEKEHEVLVKAAKGEIELPTTAEGEVQEKSAEELAKEINAMGGNVLVNEDGEVVDKRQLLKGGLNVSAKKQAELERERERKRAAEEAAERARREAREREARNRAVYAEGGKRAMLERQARMLEQQLEESRKRAREEAEQEAARLQMSTKSRKTEAEISSARERYLARKRAAEEAKKNGQAELP